MQEGEGAATLAEGPAGGLDSFYHTVFIIFHPFGMCLPLVGADFEARRPSRGV